MLGKDPTNQPSNQPSNQPIIQPTNQSTNQSTNQQANQTSKPTKPVNQHKKTKKSTKTTRKNTQTNIMFDLLETLEDVQNYLNSNKTYFFKDAKTNFFLSGDRTSCKLFINFLLTFPQFQTRFAVNIGDLKYDDEYDCIKIFQTDTTIMNINEVEEDPEDSFDFDVDIEDIDPSLFE